LFSILWKIFQKPKNDTKKNLLKKNQCGLCPIMFLRQFFFHFVKKFGKMKNYTTNLLFQIKSQKITTIAYNMKWCLRFFTFILWILHNLAKYIYGWSLLEQHHQIEFFNKNVHWPNWMKFEWEYGLKSNFHSRKTKITSLIIWNSLISGQLI